MKKKKTNTADKNRNNEAWRSQRDACMVVATSFRSRHTLTNGIFRMALCACDRPAKVLAKQALIGFTIDLNEKQQYH